MYATCSTRHKKTNYTVGHVIPNNSRQKLKIDLWLHITSRGLHPPNAAGRDTSVGSLDELFFDSFRDQFVDTFGGMSGVWDAQGS